MWALSRCSRACTLIETIAQICGIPSAAHELLSGPVDATPGKCESARLDPGLDRSAGWACPSTAGVSPTLLSVESREDRLGVFDFSAPDEVAKRVRRGAHAASQVTGG